MAAPGSLLPKEQDLGIDWRTPGGFTDAEVRIVNAWYSKNHGEGDLQGAPFVAFWLEQNSEIFKRWRRMAESALSDGFTASTVPVCMFLHTYAVMGWKEGAVYETISALKWGVTRQQVLEILGLAFIHAGPMGISNIGPGCSDYLAKWNGKVEKVVNVWPKGWASDPAAFSSGLDFLQTGMTRDEARKLANWYREHQGEVPSYIDFLANNKPELLKAFRQRLESAIVTLPKQLVPLLTFHTAAIQGRIGPIRRAAYQARRYGVLRSEIISAASLASLYAGDLGLEPIAETLEPLLRVWPSE